MKMNRNQLKYLFVAAMVIDHIAGTFVNPMTPLGMIMHFIGRLTGPGMALLLAEGYQYTKDRKKYAIRLFVFAMVSWVPYSFLYYSKWPYFYPAMFGMIWTLFVAFITVWMWDTLKAKRWVKVLLVIAGIGLSVFGDWMGAAVLWALFAYIYRDDPLKKWISYYIISVLWIIGVAVYEKSITSSLYQVGVFVVPLVFECFYNGKPGKKLSFNKWFFYVFYPLHLMVLYLIKAR